jgi:hypothetical protein
MSRLLRYVAIAACFASTAALGACLGEVGDEEDLASAQDGVIIGSNDLISVARDGGNVPARYRSTLDGFGRLLVGGAACTATHVGNGVVITAGHCFSAPSSRVNNQPCPNTTVQWGYRGGSITSTSTCTSVLAMQTGGGLDYAIFKVSPVPAVTIGVALDTPPTNGQGLTIFSHPGARPLEWSQTCSVRSTDATELTYQCDTQGGSSGASVLRDDTLQVVGIHWGGGGDANAATKLVNTPLKELLGGGPQPGPTSRFVSAASGKCLDVNASGTADGTQIQIYGCNGTGAQSFEVRDAGGGKVNLVNSSSGKCVDINGSGSADGTKVQLWGCNGTGAQSFELRSNGAIVNSASGKCLDVAGNGTADYTVVHLWTCHGGANQQWTRQ